MGVLFWLTRTHTGLQYVSIASVFLPFYRGKKLTVFATIPHSTLQVYYKGIFNEEDGLQPLLLLITINSFCNMYFYSQTS